ncbi:MAG: class I SAM-dependent methyltransferase [Actinomycetota bacterium]
MTGARAKRWADDLAAWAIPQEILDAAPESPWGFPVELFLRHTEDEPADTPSRARALEALPGGGSVLDVGCGAGAASRALVPPAALLIGVDESAEMLAAFSATAPVASEGVLGRWPDVADSVERADVVVSNHVLYNVPDIEPFVAALSDHARRRVVVEIYDEHPIAWMNPLWKEMHGIDRPDRPHAQDAYEIVRESHPDAGIERWQARAAQWEGEIDDTMFAFLRRRLCLSADRDEQLRAALARTPPPVARTAVTIWWDV